MKLITTSLPIIVGLLSALAARPSSPFEDDKSVSVPAERKVYLGFDRNEYPGDAVLPVLRKTLSFSGHWLTAPPSLRLTEPATPPFTLVGKGSQQYTFHSPQRRSSAATPAGDGAASEGSADASFHPIDSPLLPRHNAVCANSNAAAQICHRNKRGWTSASL